MTQVPDIVNKKLTHMKDMKPLGVGLHGMLGVFKRVLEEFAFRLTDNHCFLLGVEWQEMLQDFLAVLRALESMHIFTAYTIKSLFTFRPNCLPVYTCIRGTLGVVAIGSITTCVL